MGLFNLVSWWHGKAIKATCQAVVDSWWSPCRHLSCSQERNDISFGEGIEPYLTPLWGSRSKVYLYYGRSNETPDPWFSKLCRHGKPFMSLLVSRFCQCCHRKCYAWPHGLVVGHCKEVDLMRWNCWTIVARQNLLMESRSWWQVSLSVTSWCPATIGADVCIFEIVFGLGTDVWESRAFSYPVIYIYLEYSPSSFVLCIFVSLTAWFLLCLLFFFLLII